MDTLLPMSSTVFPKNRQILLPARQSFHFEKFTGTLKMNSIWGKFWVSLHFLLLNKLRNTFSFKCNLQKCKIKVEQFYRVTVNIFRGPVPTQKAAFQSNILELESYNNLAQHETRPIFLQTSLHSTTYIQYCRGPHISLGHR